MCCRSWTRERSGGKINTKEHIKRRRTPPGVVIRCQVRDSRTSSQGEVQIKLRSASEINSQPKIYEILLERDSIILLELGQPGTFGPQVL